MVPEKDNHNVHLFQSKTIIIQSNQRKKNSPSLINLLHTSLLYKLLPAVRQS